MAEPTDEEVICEWMEPTPKRGPLDFRPWRSKSPEGYWLADPAQPLLPTRHSNTWAPTKLTLDRLHEVEARLTDEQWQQYLDQLVDDEAISGYQCERDICHATVEQKIKALAAVIRAEAKRG